MEESKREEMALFRYGLILPFLGQQELEWGVKGEIARRLAEQHYNFPHSQKHTIDKETIRKWLAAYQRNGFDGLKPKSRSDIGKPRTVAPEAWEKAVALKKEAPRRSVRKIIQIMEAHNLIKPGEIKASTRAGSQELGEKPKGFQALRGRAPQSNLAVRHSLRPVLARSQSA
jgi:hypothetical protein